MGDMKQYTHRERERETDRQTDRQRHKEYLLLSRCNSYNVRATTTFTKGYKVTLYSDSLRATALYAIYTNGPNLGYQRG